jgi:putative Mn2+ efflux pump MntP
MLDIHNLLTSQIKIALLILSLGIDSLIVAVGIGIGGVSRRNSLKVGISFAIFEGITPLVGFFLGGFIGKVFGNIADFLGIIALLFVGLWMLKESILEKDKVKKISIDTWKGLVFTSSSISLDELAVGFSMGTLHLPIFLTASLIALQAFIFTLLGISVGNFIGEKLPRLEFLSGAILSLLALVLLLEKMTNLSF